MVATTSAFHLPYQQGTDPPCFGPGAGCTHLNSVWCDFVEIVEEQLDTFDAIVGRTATAIPMARISFINTSFTAGYPDTISGTIPFDTVDFDTDDMVDLNSVLGITPKRDGVYAIDLNIQLNTPAINVLYIADIVVGNETEPTNAGNKLSIGTAIQRAGTDVQAMRASALWLFTSTSPNPRAIIGDATGIFNAIPMVSASLQVVWHDDGLS